MPISVLDVDCVHPQLIEKRINGAGVGYMYVQCGKCELCIQRLKQQWTLRLRNEASLYAYNAFCTLTYNNENVPFNLCYEDFQDFLHRLRKRNYKFRYYVAGEYGSPVNTFRPHFHVIFFGMKANKKFVADVYDAWSNGFVTVSSLNDNRCKYACGYTEKKLGVKSDGVHDVLPFCRMSLKPGIGIQWFYDHYKTIKANDWQLSFRGDRYCIPRYYFKCMDPVDQISYKRMLIDKHADKVADLIEKFRKLRPDLDWKPDDLLMTDIEMHVMSQRELRCATLRRQQEIYDSEHIKRRDCV